MNISNILVISSLAFATSASAGWTTMSDAWCTKHGFNKPCEVYLTKTATQAGSGAEAQPREGDIKGTPLRFERPSAEEIKQLIFDRGMAGNLSRGAAAPQKDGAKKTPE